MNKKVSIVIPTYGRYDLISKAIESVISQSYDNKEVVVIDDNVDELIANSTRDVVSSFKTKIDIKYVKNKQNLGGALSRNEGIKNSTGEYIAFLDDDDFFAPDKLTKQIYFMEKFDFDASLCDMYVVNEDGHLSKKRHHARCTNAVDFLIRGVAMTPMLIVKKSAAINAGCFVDSIRFQDHIFVINLIKAGCKIGVLPEPLVYYYEHSSPRITNSKKSGSGYYFRFEKEKEIFHLLNEKEKNMVLFRHDVIRSKIINSESGRIKSFTFLLGIALNIRSVSDFIVWSRAMVRNTVAKDKVF